MNAMQFSENVEVNSYLHHLPYHYRMPILQVRKILLDAHQDMYESVIKGNLIFSIKNTDIFVLKVVKNSVRLIFLNGAFLQDSDNILMSFGQKSRCIELFDNNLALLKILPKYVKQAVEVANKSTKVN